MSAPQRERLYRALRDVVVEDTDLDLHFEELEIIADGIMRRLGPTTTSTTPPDSEAGP